MAVVVYSNEGCYPCKMTKKWLDQNGVGYEAKMIEDLSPEELQAFKDQGFSSAPIVVTDSETWAGYRLDKLRDLV